jgi:hypothetical protein
VRKRLWQRQKIKNDPEYEMDQKDSKQCWQEQNPDYWGKYRDKNPEYVKRNRILQKERDKKRRT